MANYGAPGGMGYDVPSGSGGGGFNSQYMSDKLVQRWRDSSYQESIRLNDMISRYSNAYDARDLSHQLKLAKQHMRETLASIGAQSSGNLNVARVHSPEAEEAAKEKFLLALTGAKESWFDKMLPFLGITNQPGGTLVDALKGIGGGLGFGGGPPEASGDLPAGSTFRQPCGRPRCSCCDRSSPWFFPYRFP